MKALMKVPSVQEIGLRKEGEQLYAKMVEATTRGLSASSGSQYYRYVALQIEIRRCNSEINFHL